MNNEVLLKLALQYFNHGWSVIPVGANKRPLIEWKKYQKERATAEQIYNWFEQFPDMQIGVVTGKISNLTVIDMEKDANFALIPDKTFTVQSGSGGVHKYFTHDSDFANAVRVVPEIDIRGEGGFIVAPGSTSVKGKYIVTDPSPIVAMSAPTKALLNKKKKADKQSKPLKELIGLKEGSRNGAMTSIVGKLLRVTKESAWNNEVWPVVVTINQSYRPPLDGEELLTIYTSISSIESRRLYEERNLREDPTEDELYNGYKKDATKATMSLAKYLVKKFHIITIGEKQREIYVYKDGKYVIGEEHYVLPDIQRILKDLTKKNAKTETLHKIEDMTANTRDIFESTDRRYLPLRNGVYDTEDKVLLPHSHEYRFLHQFPVDYKEGATCPQILEFIQGVLQPEDIPVFQEFLGFLFYRKYSFKKAMIFVGERDTGKTSLLSVITALVGKQNTSGLSLQKISTDRFATATLYAKHVNLLDDLSSDDVHNTGQFKMAVGGGYVSAEYKYGNAFMFQSYAKLLFACNKIPEINDTDDLAFYSRWIILPFTNKVTKRVQNIDEKLTTPDELSGLFLWAIEGLHRLLEAEEFSMSKDANDTRIQMMESASSIARFVARAIYRDDNSDITKNVMYNAYTDFCIKQGIASFTKDKFSKNFLRYCNFASDGQTGDYGGRRNERIWRGAGIKGMEKNEATATNEAMAQVVAEF